MLNHHQLSKTAVAVSLFCSTLALTGCGSDNKPTPVVQPTPNTDNQPTSIFTPVQGHWNKLGYGEFIHIDQDKIDMYEFNDFGCIKTDSFSYADAEPLVTQVSKTDDDEMALLLNGAVFTEYYQSQDAVPQSCETPITIDATISPQASFDYFWHTFNDYYAFFEQRNVDWQQLYDQYRPQVNDETTDEQLFEIFSAMITPLADAHVSVANSNSGFSVGKPVPLNNGMLGMIGQSHRSGNPTTIEQIELLFSHVYLNHQQSYVTAQSLAQYPADDNFPTLLWGKTADNVGVLVLNNMYFFADDGVDANTLDTPAILAAVKQKMDAAMLVLKDTDGLILDIRNNEGGADAISLAIAQYFANKDTVAFNKQAVNRAGEGHVYSASLTLNDAAYTKPVYLLTSQRTTSAAEIFTLAMKQLDHVTLVGEETSGALSDVLSFNLPNGWRISLSNEVYKDAAGQAYEVSGFAPDYAVPAYTLESLQSQSFETYEFALKKLGKWQKPQLSSQSFEAQLAGFMAYGKVPGVAVAVVKSGEIVYQKGFGRADESDRAVTPQTPFFLASVSKTLLGTTMAQAVADGELSLDDKIQPLLDFEINYPQQTDFELSFRHLVTHTSGIIDEDVSFGCSYYIVEDKSSLFDQFSDEAMCNDDINTDMELFLANYLDQDGERYQAANFTSSYGIAPGGINHYSNFATALAGLALEKKTGKTLPQLSEQYVFAPLGLTDTRWSIDGIPLNVASRYYVDDSGHAMPLPVYNGITYPDGGAISSAHDLAKYMIAAMNEGKYQEQQVLQSTAVEQMLTSQSDVPVTERGVGYYWRLDGDYFSHNGGDPGVMTEIWADTNKDIAVVLLTNGDTFNDDATESFNEMLRLLKTFARSL